MIHELKCWPEYFQAVADGAKTAEWRREDDRHFDLGDSLVLRERDPAANAYTGRELVAVVTHLVRGPVFGIPEGYVMMSLWPTALRKGLF